MKFISIGLAFGIFCIATGNNDIIINLSPWTHMINETSYIPQTDYGPFIVGGEEANRNEFPSIVNLQLIFLNDSNQSEFFGICGGSIIDPEWILTAAHCIVQPGATLRSVRVIAGDHNRDSEDGTEQIIFGELVVIRGEYDPNTLENDIGLVQLNRSLIINTSVQIASISESSYTAPEGTFGVIAGWGRINNDSPSLSTVLRKANVSIVSNRDCSNSYSNSPGVEIVSSMLCAGAAGKGACNGDSGGPIYCPSISGDELFVCGITSFGALNQCGNEKFPTVYTRTSNFAWWIKTYAENLKTNTGFNSTSILKPELLIIMISTAISKLFSTQ